MTLPSIKRGRVSRPQKIVIYAPEGLGKSTIASQLPAPIFFDLEQGTHHLDVARIEPASLKEVETAIDSLARDTHGFRTLVIDTIDWLEELAIQAICETHQKKGIEDFGYGKGYVFLAERITSLLCRLDALQRTGGMHIVLLAHSTVRKFELPEQGGAFDRYELKLSRQVGPLIKEWCDALLFGNWKTQVKQPDQGANKGLGGRERRIHATHCASWDAKNRHGLKDEEPWSVETLGKVLGAAAPGGDTQPGASVKQTSGAAAPADSNGSRESAAHEDQIPGPPPQAMKRLQDELPPILESHAEAVNRFLIRRGEIRDGQTYRDLSDNYTRRILANPAGFLKVVNQQQTQKEPAAA